MKTWPIREVVALIEERGSGTVDDLMPELEGVTRGQAIRALINAARAGRIACDGRKFQRGRRGTVPATYRVIIPPVHQRPANSVWEWGARA
jgi:hypothetical protein